MVIRASWPWIKGRVFRIGEGPADEGGDWLTSAVDMPLRRRARLMQSVADHEKGTKREYRSRSAACRTLTASPIRSSPASGRSTLYASRGFDGGTK